MLKYHCFYENKTFIIDHVYKKLILNDEVKGLGLIFDRKNN